MSAVFIVRKRLMRRTANANLYGMDVCYIDDSHGQLWLKEAREISSMISGLMKTRRHVLKKE